jgi:ribonuclease HI
MTGEAPRYFLFSGSKEGADTGHWQFVLRHADGSQRLMAEDVEPGLSGERLELLTIVRGLEALEQPSRVTLMTASSYVREGVRRGVLEWRKNGWRWERFGQMVPVKNLDLWQRVDRAMQFHQIDCRTYRIDPPHRRVKTARREASLRNAPSRAGRPVMAQAIRQAIECWVERIASRLRRRTANSVR